MSDARVGALLAGFAHDLRTPLATIYGFAKTIERQGDLSETQARFLGLIADAAADMDRMIENLTLVGHVLEGRWVPDPVPIATDALAALVVTAVRPRPDGRPVELTAGVAGTVATDPARAPGALALVAEAALRLDPGCPAATVAPTLDGIRIAPFADHLVAVVAEPGRDVPVEAARMALERLGGAIAADGATVVVRFAPGSAQQA
jgi:signal transduction histidine kinase